MTTWRARADPSRDAGILALLLGASLVVLVPDILLGALYPALAAHYGVPLETVVLLTTPRALAQLGILALGPLSARIGQANLLVGGLVVAAASAWGAALAPGLRAMAVVQVGMGLALAIGNAGIPALVGDRFAYAVRGRALAVIRLSMPLTLIVAVPALVALASRAGVRAPFVALGATGTVLMALAAWRLPGLAGPPPAESAAPPVRHLGARGLAVLALALCLSMVPTAVFAFLAAWVGQTFGNPGLTVGVAVGCDGMGALLGVMLSATLVDRLTKRRAGMLGLLAAGIFAVLLPAAGRAFPLACLAIAGFSGALELTFVAFMALLSEMVPEARGTVMALWAAALALGAALAPIGARVVWSAWGMTGLGRTGGALLAALALALAFAAAEPAGARACPRSE